MQIKWEQFKIVVNSRSLKLKSDKHLSQFGRDMSISILFENNADSYFRRSAKQCFKYIICEALQNSKKNVFC